MVLLSWLASDTTAGIREPPRKPMAGPGMGPGNLPFDFHCGKPRAEREGPGKGPGDLTLRRFCP